MIIIYISQLIPYIPPISLIPLIHDSFVNVAMIIAHVSAPKEARADSRYLQLLESHEGAAKIQAAKHGH